MKSSIITAVLLIVIFSNCQKGSDPKPENPTLLGFWHISSYIKSNCANPYDNSDSTYVCADHCTKWIFYEDKFVTQEIRNTTDLIDHTEGTYTLTTDSLYLNRDIHGYKVTLSLKTLKLIGSTQGCTQTLILEKE